MKISQMLIREDFYAINEKTLADYYKCQEGQCCLYVYPQLNAIVTKHPSRAVKDYLFCEYEIRSNLLKRLAVNAYVFGCLNSGGLMSAKKISVPAYVCDDTLIYPCNKKYRIFDFKNKTVDVIVKDGFNDRDLIREIEFRTKPNLPEFVPLLISSSNNGYREKIINGRSLARITSGFDKYRDEAYRQLMFFAEPQSSWVISKDYVVQLKTQIDVLISSSKVRNKKRVEEFVDLLINMCSSNDKVQLCFSHGDLQAGNIWIEDKTDKIYIIDWESWAERSIWYDKATLFQGLRPGSIDKYLDCNVETTEKAIVLLEDLIFRLKELNNLPLNFGEEQFEEYITKTSTWINMI